MYLCYLDESGTPEIGGNTEHFVYAGIAIPADTWKAKDEEVHAIKSRYGLEHAEIHTGWMVRKYFEQEKIDGFADKDRATRLLEASRERVQYLNKLTVEGRQKLKRDKEKYFEKTRKYLHLTYDERISFIAEVVACVKNWEDSRIFFHAIRKEDYEPSLSTTGGIYEDAFQQVISRYQQFLLFKGNNDGGHLSGLLISDNNYSVSTRLTKLARKFHRDGTFWREITNIVENPLFVDSVLTSMVQIADVVAYTVRRYYDNAERDHFEGLLLRVDRVRGTYVGARHDVSKQRCQCLICVNRQTRISRKRRHVNGSRP